MTPDKFSLAVDSIVLRDPRFERDAYLFVRDALEFTAKRRKKPSPSAARQPAAENAGAEGHHVSGQELLEGVRQHALEQFGPMVPVVFEHWRVNCCEDIGSMVFNLIDAGVFGKTDRDAIEDFSAGYDFHEAFVAPFLPPNAAKARTAGNPAPASSRKPA
jgi:uncharacterized repeat protein (TIGR04138 family)